MMRSMPDPQHFTFEATSFASTVAHDGRGILSAARVFDRGEAPGYAFVDLVVVPPGGTIGRHTHGDDEELYVVVSGTAAMEVDGRLLRVSSGDVVVNRPGGTHALDNDSEEPLRLVVVDVRTQPRRR